MKNRMEEQLKAKLYLIDLESKKNNRKFNINFITMTIVWVISFTSFYVSLSILLDQLNDSKHLYFLIIDSILLGIMLNNMFRKINKK